MTRIWIGIDPGLEGAIAVRTPERIEIMPMPVVSALKGRPQYDIPALVELLDEQSVESRGAALVTCEKLQPMPLEHGGTIANYNRGRAMALVEAICATLGIPYQLVAPRTWQSRMHLGTSGTDLKQRSIQAAQRLFPGVSLLRTERSRVPHDGMAEALLLAEWGRLTHTATQMAAAS